MNHSIKVSGNHVKAFLKGKVYSQDASIFRDELLEHIEQGVTEISIDLSELTYIDSTGLGVLITIHKRTKEKNGKIVITGAQGMVEQLFKRTRLDRVLIME
ncbi:STAS domain-containing protein [Pelosinus sp. sgz500959]|uniref:STAS domain-containing protein n=1 Tax=Pelosinus sp. sgz500959 TaxID=3242472 RepID=UPI00367222DB